MYKLTDTLVLILLIFCSFFLSVAYTTLLKLFAIFYTLFYGYG